MPTTVNLPGNGVQLGRNLVQSAVYTAYASVTNQVEVAVATARYFVGHFFSGKNGAGTDFGEVSIDTTDLLLTYAGRASITDALAAIFPPPGPD
jgi:hypothetical protein